MADFLGVECPILASRNRRRCRRIGNAGLANADEKRHPLPDDAFQANAQVGYGKCCLQSVILAEHFPVRYLDYSGQCGDAFSIAGYSSPH
ncbi:hypothetical protein [Delftia acidovorans]|uniref:hypothetical protein n=1 Tax=Delftia acidovorans TaxID=80866 RepID=UPI0018E7A7D2|nr:hypothetical protein [Delftia acidovorans]